jgi:hypothetical protein
MHAASSDSDDADAASDDSESCPFEPEDALDSEEVGRSRLQRVELAGDSDSSEEDGEDVDPDDMSSDSEEDGADGADDDSRVVATSLGASTADGAAPEPLASTTDDPQRPSARKDRERKTRSHPLSTDPDNVRQRVQFELKRAQQRAAHRAAVAGNNRVTSRRGRKSTGVSSKEFAGSASDY